MVAGRIGEPEIWNPVPTTEMPVTVLAPVSNFEDLASASLLGKGYEEFLPLYRSRRRWSDRIKELDLPLFPGYLFCRFDADNRLPILTTPVAVSDEEIGAVQAIIRSGLPAQPWPCLTVGSRIFIERGPLAGVEGIALNVEKKYRLVVSVPLLQRSVAVEIAREWARPILNGSEPRPPPAPASFRNTGLSNRTNRNPPAWSRAICRTTPVDRK